MQGKSFEVKKGGLTSNPTTLFIIGAVLGALSCFSRADYNLPFMAFLAVMWSQDDVSYFFISYLLKNEKNHIRFLLILTSVIDVFWLLFWIPYYNDKEISKFNYGLHMFVVLISMIEVGLKVIIFFVLFNSNAN